MRTIHWVKGERKTVRFLCRDRNGEPVDLTGYSKVELSIAPSGADSETIRIVTGHEDNIEVVEAQGIVDVLLSEANAGLLTEGRWQASLTVQFGSGIVVKSERIIFDVDEDV